MSHSYDEFSCYGCKKNYEINVALKGQKWIAQRDVKFTAVYIYGNKDSNGYQ